MIKKIANKLCGKFAKNSAVKTVADYYSPSVISVSPSATIGQALKLMVKHQANSVIVVEGNKNKKVKGIFSLQDAISLLIPDYLENDEHLASFPSDDMLEVELAKIKNEKVEKCMTRKVLALKKDDSIAKAVTILAVKRFRQAPVVDEDNNLIGYISRGRIKRALAELLK